MLRFLLPALVMVGALIVLLAGASGDFQSLPNLPSSIPSLVTSITPDHVSQPAKGMPPAEPTPAEPAGSVQQATGAPPIAPTAPVVQPALDDLQRQAADLQAQIAQRTKQLASLQGNEDQARHELDTLRQQRADEEAALERLKTQEQQASNPPAPAPGPSTAQPQSQPPPSAAPPSRNEVQTTMSRLRAEQKQTAAVTPDSASTRAARTQQSRSAAAPSLLPQTATEVSSWNDLSNARTLLTSGRVAEARQTLIKAQAQSVLQPVTPDQPYAVGNNATALQIRDAIRMLDRGSPNGALQAIDLAMNSSRDVAQAWPSYPPPPPPGYGHPTAPSYYYNGPSQ